MPSSPSCDGRWPKRPADLAGTRGRRTASAALGRPIPRPRRSSKAGRAAHYCRAWISMTQLRRPSSPNTSRPYSGSGAARDRGAVPRRRGRRRERPAARHTGREHHSPSRHQASPRRAVRAPHRRAALRNDRDQRVDRCRLPRSVRDLGSVPRTPPRRRAERNRCRAQRVSARRHGADDRIGPVPTGTPVVGAQVAVARRRDDLAEAAVVRRQPDSRCHRSTPCLVRGATARQRTPAHLRVGAAWMSGK